jgi:membrane-bound lytic murein transglycosylase MltF
VQTNRTGVIQTVFLGLVVLLGCGDNRSTAEPAAETQGAAGTATQVGSTPASSEARPDSAAQAAPPPAIFAPWKGDLDEMVKRRAIRVLVAYNKTTYFVDKGTPRGAAYEALKSFEAELNKKRQLGHLGVNAVFVPTSRDRLLADLAAGKGDVAAGNLTITEERRKLVDFTVPLAEGVSEIVVTGPGAPPIATVDDLSGREVFVRTESSYHESLVALNERLAQAGKKPATLRPAPPELEDEDLLEMTNAGLVPIVVVDRHLAEFWKQVLPDLTLHETATLRTGAAIGWAIRKGSPQLAAELNGFIGTHGKGTAFGNVVLKKYLENVKFVKNSASEAELAKYRRLRELFQKYGDKYGVDWLLMAAQGYQESGLDQNVKSQVGAIGVMQVMPATGKEMEVGDVTEVEPNIHAGVKYMRWMIDHYYKDEPMKPIDKALFSFASYNAGPGRMRGLRKEAAARGLDPNVWFNNVERVAAEKIGRETVTYVSNIFKYYIAYKLIAEQAADRESVKQELGRPRR